MWGQALRTAIWGNRDPNGRLATTQRDPRHVSHLRSIGNSAIDLCDACLAFATERSLADIRQVLDELAPFTEFRRRDALCTVCGRTRLVTSVVVDESTPTPEELQTLVTGTGLYRGWRLDLLSYRLPSGWRPFVLIKGPGVSLTSDPPCLLSGTSSSKAEADRHALRAAKDWLDKTLGCRAAAGEERPVRAPQDDDEARRGPSPRDPMSDAFDAFFLEHSLCGILKSAVDDERISLTCRGCGASLVLPLS